MTPRATRSLRTGPCGRPPPARRSGDLRSGVAALALGTTCICQLACDGWTWGEDAPRPEADGSPFAIQVLGTKECPLEATVSPDDELPSPPLGVELRITGWDPGGTPVNFYYARLEDSAGATYPAQPACEPLLEGLPLASGERTQGYVSFSVPDSEGPYTLVYEPRLVDASGRSHKRRVTVPLGKHP